MMACGAPLTANCIDLTAAQFRKYSATLSCQDQDVPALTDIWQGQIVAITLIPVYRHWHCHTEHDGDQLDHQTR